MQPRDIVQLWRDHKFGSVVLNQSLQQTAESANQHTLTGDLACSYLVRNGFLSLSKQVSTFSHINKGCSMRDDGYWDEANTKCKHNKTCTDWKHARMLTACWGFTRGYAGKSSFPGLLWWQYHVLATPRGSVTESFSRHPANCRMGRLWLG